MDLIWIESPAEPGVSYAIHRDYIYRREHADRVTPSATPSVITLTADILARELVLLLKANSLDWYPRQRELLQALQTYSHVREIELIERERDPQKVQINEPSPKTQRSR